MLIVITIYKIKMEADNMEDPFEYLMSDSHLYHLNKEFQSNIESAGYNDEIVDDKIKLMPSMEVTKPVGCNFITVKSVGKIEFIDYNDIIWLYASANYIEIFLDGRSILHRESLTNLEKKFKNTQFARVHRSSIINLNKIKSIESENGKYNSITLTNGHNVKLSKTYRTDLFKHLGVETA